MIRAGVGLSTKTDGPDAIAEAAQAALEGAGGAELAIVFMTPGYPDGLEPLLGVSIDALGTERIVGASAHGVLAGGVECEGEPSVAVMAIAGVDSQPFLVSEVRGRESSVGAEIAAQLPGGPRSEDLILVLPDPRLDTGALVRGIDSSLAPAQIVGAGAADPILGSPLQWLGAEAESEAVAGIALRGSNVRVGVTQACRPSTELMTITQVQGNWIIELDGRPALDVFRDAARGRLAEDLQRAAAFVLIALPCDDEAPLAPGNYLVRHVVGISPENGAFALPDQMSRGQKIALAVREPEAARLDLKAMLAGLEGGSPALGLYFNCCARGSAFFGMEGMEAAYLEHSFRDTPIAGMFGSCEIGPIGGAKQRNAELLTYTGVLALLQG